MAIEFDSKGVRGFQEALRKYELASSRTRREVLMHRGQRFAYALYMAARRVGVAARRKIRAIPAGNIRPRNPDSSRKKEKARRIFSVGFVASGFIPAIKFFRSRGSLSVLNKVDSPSGRVDANFSANYLDIVNSTRGAAEADSLHDISGTAYRGQEADMQKYLERKSAQDLERSWR
jgi:hypothetical protein